MARLVIDIETAGRDFESLPEPVRQYLLKDAETDEERREVIGSLGLYPHTAEIITIGMLNPDTGKGTVLYQNGGDPLLPFEEEGFRFESATEQELLGRFWDAVKSCDQIVTFNGRSFDCPFIIVRSAAHRIKPKKDLMTNRYGDGHIDLCDQLTFFGASRRRFSLDMWCRTFGIDSPKEAGISGSAVGDYYKAGGYLDIARYCARDVRATAELLFVWEKFVRPSSYR